MISWVGQVKEIIKVLLCFISLKVSILNVWNQECPDLNKCWELRGKEDMRANGSRLLLLFNH